MTFKITRVLLLLAMGGSAFAAEPYEAWPSREQLRNIEQAAYACSRDNTTEACARVRQLADPLMDSQRLPGLCKDVLWALMDEAKVASTNDSPQGQHHQHGEAHPEGLRRAGQEKRKAQIASDLSFSEPQSRSRLNGCACPCISRLLPSTDGDQCDDAEPSSRSSNVSEVTSISSMLSSLS